MIVLGVLEVALDFFWKRAAASRVGSQETPVPN
jgi:hypothetical protein